MRPHHQIRSGINKGIGRLLLGRLNDRIVFIAEMGVDDHKIRLCFGNLDGGAGPCQDIAPRNSRIFSLGHRRKILLFRPGSGHKSHLYSVFFQNVGCIGLLRIPSGTDCGKIHFRKSIQRIQESVLSEIINMVVGQADQIRSHFFEHFGCGHRGPEGIALPCKSCSPVADRRLTVHRQKVHRLQLLQKRG